MGIVKCKLRAKECIFWPQMCKEIDDLVTNCSTCNLVPSNHAKEPLILREIPKAPWKMLGSDIFEFNNRQYLILVDYYTKFAEVEELHDMSSETTIKVFK